MPIFREPGVAAAFDPHQLFLGPHTDDPTKDNHGRPLTKGAWYFNTTTNYIRVYNGTTFSPLIGTDSLADYTAVMNAIEADRVEIVGHKDAAATSASNASTSATNAATSASNAATSATNASNSAGAAATSATNASNSASSAQTATTQAIGYRDEAGTSATNAAASANTATTKASEAATSAGNAANSATTANTKANEAAASASAALTSETNAAGSASAAATSATTADGHRASASTHATTASNDRQQASNSAAEAATSATNAANSATTASTKASEASASAAQASAVSTANEPVRHSERPSLLLDFAKAKRLDPRITFTRGSNVYHYDGKTRKRGDENMFVYSQSLANATWTKTETTASDNAAVAPDGTSTASLLAEAATTAQHYVSQGSLYFVNSSYTLSFYAKAGTVSVVQGLMNATAFGTAVWANFDLTNGVIGSSGASGTYSITAVGNGWYRCTVTGTCTTGGSNTSGAVIFCNNLTTAARAPSYLGATTSNVYIWGMQQEERNYVTPYVKTDANRVAEHFYPLVYSTAHQPIFEHDPITGECKGLRIEDQRTNLILHSSDFMEVNWQIGIAMVRRGNEQIAPDGNLTADWVENTDGADYRSIYKTGIGVVSGNIYNFSCYVRAGSSNVVHLRVISGTNDADIRVSDLAARTFTTVANAGSPAISNAKVEDVGGNWRRVSFSFTTDGTTCNVYIYPRGQTPAGGKGGVWLWGSQLEANYYASSYIYTTTASVNRSRCVAEMTGISSWYNDKEGTLFLEAYESPMGAGFPRYVAFTHATSVVLGHESIGIYSSAATSYVGCHIHTYATSRYDKAGAVTNGNKFRFALGYGATPHAYLDGTSLVAGTQAVQPQLGRVRFGQGQDVYANTIISKFAYYPKRLLDSELQTLTSW